MSIDLFLKKIAIEKFFEENIDTVRGFIKQYNLFMKTDVLIDKIICLYKYYESISNELTENISKLSS